MSAGKKPAEHLSDFDIDSDEDGEVEEIEGTCLQKFLIVCRNFVSFCKYHLTYRIIVSFGISCLIVALGFIINTANEVDLLRRADLLNASIYFNSFCIGLIFAVTALANMEDCYEKDTRYLNYTAFGKYIHVPMKVVAGKFFAATLTGCIYIFKMIAGLIHFVACIYFMSFHQKTKSCIRALHEGYQIVDIYILVVPFLILGIVSSYAIMRCAVVYWYARAKMNLLITMERNWQRNISACEILLQGETVHSITELQSRLLSISERECTEKEMQVLDYIEMPLWKPKQPFVEKNE